LSEQLHCENHPNVETSLRCNRCAKPICTRCAVRTPVGYRCKECVRSQQRVYYDEFGPAQYAVAAAVALPLSFLAGWLIPQLGWFAIFLGPLTGTVIARAVRWAVRRKRGEYTWLVVCGSIVLGAALPIISFVVVPLIASATGAGGSGLGRLLGLLWSAVYLVTAVGSAYAWLRPGRIS
jgi:hypothetical protein